MACYTVDDYLNEVISYGGILVRRELAIELLRGDGASFVIDQLLNGSSRGEGTGDAETDGERR